MSEVVVSGSFDDLRSRHIRVLHAAAQDGPVRVRLWSDRAVLAATGAPPRFPLDERRYVLESIRWVAAVSVVDVVDGVDAVDGVGGETSGSALLDAPLCFSEHETNAASERRGVVVTGCYDWLHSGHVRFFEEASSFGDLTVVVGSDKNVRLLKGEGHPLFPQEERRYMVGAIRFVHRALVATGMGWLDAEPEIEVIKPAAYVVNEDGDRAEKRAYCETTGIRYVVLKRLPRPGLARRQSTDLRGF